MIVIITFFLYGWIDRWMNEWMDRWMNEWMDR